jgi:hypothetical protein
MVLADRTACLKGGVVADVVVPTPDYVRLASHYGFAPDFCHAQDPESKGIVEDLVGYAQCDLFVPLLTEGQVSGRVQGATPPGRNNQRGTKFRFHGLITPQNRAPADPRAHGARGRAGPRPVGTGRAVMRCHGRSVG